MAIWKFEGNEIFVAPDTDEENFKRFSCRFEILEKRINILTNEEAVKIKVTNGYTNPTITVSRDAITENSIVDTLTKYGVSLSNHKKVQALVKEILVDTEESATVTLYHDKLGFVTIGDNEFYLADRLYSAVPTPLEKSVHIAPEMQPKGTMSEYRKFILKEVVNSPKLALGLAMGVTAPVAHILKKEGIFYEGLLFSYCGESSTGKTTMLKAGLANFGNSSFLLNNLNATSNALSAQISGHSGFPFVADEATKSKLDFNELIYSLASGRDKRRCNGDGSLKPVVNFSGAAFFSSEQPILDKCDNQGGQEARVIEFELNWFDDDSKKAERFLQFFNTHYGVAISKLAPMLLDIQIQRKIIKLFFRYTQQICKKVSVKDGVDKRIVQRLSIILTSCWLLQKAIKVDLHMADIEKLLLEVFAEKQTRLCRSKPAEMLMQLFLEDFLNNRDEYSADESIKKGTRHTNYSSLGTSKSQRGALSKFQGKSCLWLPLNVFNEILSKQTTYGTSTAKKKLHEAGYLEKFGNSYYSWHNFGLMSANAYCLNLPTLTLEDNSVRDTATVEAIQIVPKKKLITGFVRLTAQESALLINDELVSQLNITPRKRVFLHLWAAKDFLYIATAPSDKACEIGFEMIGNTLVSCDDTIDAVISALSLSLKNNERVLFTDITILGKNPTAIIRLSNPRGQFYDTVSEKVPFSLTDFSPKQKILNNQSLLEDD